MGIPITKPSNKTMVDSLVNTRSNGPYITSSNVEGVFRAVDRGMYFEMDENESIDPYTEQPWRRGNLHLSAPCIYAKAVEALDLRSGHSFLNLGSGTGYLNTIVGLLIGPNGINHGIEYYQDVIDYAYKRLEIFKNQSYAIDKYDFSEPIFVKGNCVNLNPYTRYDRVYLGAACSPELEQFMKKLIKPDGGILVMPYDDRLLRYKRVSESQYKIDCLMCVNFTLMISANDESDKMIDMPQAQTKTLKELCRIKIRQHLRDKANQLNPKLLNSDNVESRRRRKQKAEARMLAKQEKKSRYSRYETRRPECHCNRTTSHRYCLRSCRNRAGDKVSSSQIAGNLLSGDRVMTRSLRRRLELARALDLVNQLSTNSNNRPFHLGNRDDTTSDEESSSAMNDSDYVDSDESRDDHDHRGSDGRGSRIIGSGDCSRTRPFESRRGRDQAPSPARRGFPYSMVRSTYPASQRSYIHRIFERSTYRPVPLSPPSRPSTSSSSSSSSNSASYMENDHEYINRRRASSGWPSMLRIQDFTSVSDEGDISNNLENEESDMSDSNQWSTSYDEDDDDDDSRSNVSDSWVKFLEDYYRGNNLSEINDQEEAHDVEGEDDDDEGDDESDHDDGDPLSPPYLSSPYFYDSDFSECSTSDNDCPNPHLSEPVDLNSLPYHSPGSSSCSWATVSDEPSTSETQLQSHNDEVGQASSSLWKQAPSEPVSSRLRSKRLPVEQDLRSEVERTNDVIVDPRDRPIPSCSRDTPLGRLQSNDCQTMSTSSVQRKRQRDCCRARNICTARNCCEPCQCQIESKETNISDTQPSIRHRSDEFLEEGSVTNDEQQPSGDRRNRDQGRRGIVASRFLLASRYSTHLTITARAYLPPSERYNSPASASSASGFVTTRSNASAAMSSSSSSAFPSSRFFDRRTHGDGSGSSIGPSRYHHCHKQQRIDRKRKRRSSSSECSEASNASSPSRRRLVAARCGHTAMRQNERLRRRCGCSQGTVPSSTINQPMSVTPAASINDNQGPSATQAVSNQSTSELQLDIVRRQENLNSLTATASSDVNRPAACSTCSSGNDKSTQKDRKQDNSAHKCHHNHHHHNRHCHYSAYHRSGCRRWIRSRASVVHQSGNKGIESSSANDKETTRRKGGCEQQAKEKVRKRRRRKRTGENECQRYHNHMSSYINQLPIPRVLHSYLNFDRIKAKKK